MGGTTCTLDTVDMSVATCKRNRVVLTELVTSVGIGKHQVPVGYSTPFGDLYNTYAIQVERGNINYSIT